MLITLEEIKQTFDLQIDSIIHVGAHKAEELNSYMSNGIKKVVWIEANPNLVSYLKSTLRGSYSCVLHAAISDEDDQEIEFKITNNGQSSSILELGTHKDLFPGVGVVEKIKLNTKTLRTLFKENEIEFQDFQMINLDIQGAELMALKGMGDEIRHLQAIYTEINTDYVYENCSLVTEIDDYVSKYGFKRIATKMWQNHPWGDALYIRGEE